MKQQFLENQIDLLRAEIEQLKKIKLAVIIQNGQIQHVAANKTMDIAVINYDECMIPDRIVTFTQPDQVIPRIHQCGYLQHLEQDDPITEYAVKILQPHNF